MHTSQLSRQAKEAIEIVLRRLGRSKQIWKVDIGKVAAEWPDDGAQVQSVAEHYIFDGQPESEPGTLNSPVDAAPGGSLRLGSTTPSLPINPEIVLNILRTPVLVAAFSSNASRQTPRERAASEDDPLWAAMRTWMVAATKVV
jgi:hypothetical protein